MTFVQRLAAASALALASAGAVAPASAEGTLVIGTAQVPRHFNGAIQSGTATGMVSTQVFASPVRFDSDWNPQPYVATSWETAEDGLSMTLHLRDDVLFHDGEKLTSADVKFTIETIKANHPFTTMLAPVTEVETPDDTTVIIHLDHPHPALLLAMSPALMPILPEHVYGEGDIKASPANLAPIGAGPFKLVEYKQGEVIRLEKNEDFFLAGKPAMDEVIFQIFGDPANLVLSTERGDVDFAPFQTGVRDIQRLTDAAGVSIATEGYDGIGALNWLAFNTRKAPFDNADVRRAIGYALDKDFYLNRLLGGVSAPAFGPIVPTSPLATDEVETYALDMEKAKALLDGAGLTPDADGIRFKMTVDFIPGQVEQGRNLAEYMRTQLRQVGIEVEVRVSPDFPTWAQRISTYDFDVTEDAVFNWGDPVIGVNRTYLSSNIREGVIWSNTQSYSNPKVDELLAAAAVETDPAKRAELYKEFQQIVVDEAPILYMNVLPYTTAYSDKLTGLPDSIWGPISPLLDIDWAE